MNIFAGNKLKDEKENQTKQAYQKSISDSQEKRDLAEKEYSEVEINVQIQDEEREKHRKEKAAYQ